MTSVVNARVIFNSIPQGIMFLKKSSSNLKTLTTFSWIQGFPEPGKTTVYDTSEKIDVEKVPLNGGLLIRVLELSIDPYMRNRMREPSIKSYLVECFSFFFLSWYNDCSNNNPLNHLSLTRMHMLLEKRKIFFLNIIRWTP